MAPVRYQKSYSEFAHSVSISRSAGEANRLAQEIGIRCPLHERTG